MTDRASLEARLNYLRQQRKAWEKREKINSENFYLTPNHQSLNGSFKTPQNLVRASLFVEYAQALLDIEKQGHPLQAWTKFLRSITPSSFLSSPNSNKLLKIYEKATRSIVQCKENNNNLDFLRIWVTYAHLQKKLSLEDARDTFKYMMSERIGHHVAFFYLAWADFELKTGNTDKAKQILQKALQKGIEPQHSIKAALQLVVQGAISLLTDTEISVNCSNEDTPMQEMLKVEKSINIYPTPESDHKVFHPKTFEKNIEIQKQEACFSKLSISEENNNNNKVFTVNNSEVISKNNSKCSENEVATNELYNNNKVYNEKGHEENRESDCNNNNNNNNNNKVFSINKKEINLYNNDIHIDSKLLKTDESPQDTSRVGTNHLEAKPELTPVDHRDPHFIKNHEASKKTDSPIKAESFTKALPPPGDCAFLLKGAKYTKLEVLGKGGSSTVYKVLGEDKVVYALKHVNLQNVDCITLKGYASEIEVLNKLREHEQIIRIYNSEITARYIYVLMECGDIDLAQLLKRQSLHALSENHIRLYWQQMLEAVQVIHNHRIVHGDLKPANFLFVEGRLKLIDFGIAKTIREDHTSAYRDSQAIVGTLNYMSPEAIQGTEIHSLNPNEPSKTCVKLGPSSDIWSLGCILYAMVYGKTPFQHITMPIKKMQAIIDDQYEIKFPDIYNEFLLDVLHNCLKRKPTERLTIRQLLQHPFLHPSASQKNIFLRTPKNDKQLKDVVKRYLLSQSHTPRTAEKISQDLIKKLHEPSI